MFIQLLASVKTQLRFEHFFPYCSGAGLKTLPLTDFFVIFCRLVKKASDKKFISKSYFIFGLMIL